MLKKMEVIAVTAVVDAVVAAIVHASQKVVRKFILIIL